jgi:hypothetical protein
MELGTRRGAWVNPAVGARLSAMRGKQGPASTTVCKTIFTLSCNCFRRGVSTKLMVGYP